MKRTAFLITLLFVVSVVLLPKSNTQRLTSYHHSLGHIDAPIRTMFVGHIDPLVFELAALAAIPKPPPITDATSTATGDWQCIRTHESGGRYNDPTAPSGAYGIEFTPHVPTWQSLGYVGQPWQGTPAQQDAAALTLYHRYGWTPWSSRFACGL